MSDWRLTFTVQFYCDDGAFAGDREAAIVKVLRYVARRVAEHSTLSQTIRAKNGRTIGFFRLEDSAASGLAR